jgi:hypothetical protein
LTNGSFKPKNGGLNGGDNQNKEADGNNILTDLVSTIWSFGSKLFISDENDSEDFSELSSEELKKEYINLDLVKEIEKYLQDYYVNIEYSYRHSSNSQIMGQAAMSHPSDSSLAGVPNNGYYLITQTLNYSEDHFHQFIMKAIKHYTNTIDLIDFIPLVTKMLQNPTSFQVLLSYLFATGFLIKIDDSVVQINQKLVSISTRRITPADSHSEESCLAMLRMRQSIQSLRHQMQALEVKVNQYQLNALNAKVSKLRY